jgi:hypothetical protein
LCFERPLFKRKDKTVNLRPPAQLLEARGQRPSNAVKACPGWPDRWRGRAIRATNAPDQCAAFAELRMA